MYSLQHLAGLFQVCSNYALGPYTVSYRGSQALYRLMEGKHEKISSGTTMPRYPTHYGSNNEQIEPPP